MGSFKTSTTKGATAIQYIAALILAVAVIAVIGYWFFIVSGKAGGEAANIACTGKQVSYCTAWKAISGCTSPTPQFQMDWAGCDPPTSTSDCAEVGVTC